MFPHIHLIGTPLKVTCDILFLQKLPAANEQKDRERLWHKDKEQFRAQDKENSRVGYRGFFGAASCDIGVWQK